MTDQTTFVFERINSIREATARLLGGSPDRYPAASDRYPDDVRVEIRTTLAEIDERLWDLVDALDETTFNVEETAR